MKSRKLLIGLLTLMFAAGISAIIPAVAYGQAALGLNWTSLGPDNYSGRTRALLLSNQDQQHKTLYAGGVSGGLWKSVTKGLTWTQIPTDNVILNVSCIAQSPNGDIYVGTGEGFASERFNLFSGFIGQGIYKSTDGSTFTKLSSTDPGTTNNPAAEWAIVNKIAAGDNKVYAATNGGLKVSMDGGATWVLAKAGDVNLSEPSTEVDIATDGTVVASVGNKVYLSANGAADAFALISSDNTGENLLPHSNLARIEMAFAPSDVNTIYAVLIANGFDATYMKGGLVGVYVSKDKGQTWRLIGPGGSTQFNVFGSSTTHYGDYAACVTVDDNDPETLYVGGINIWRGKKVLETGFYEWQAKTSATSRYHNLVFQPGTDSIAYIATDQGIFTTNNDFEIITALNRNYKTSMFYSVAADHMGRVIGGTQGNGVVFIDGNGNTPQAGNMIVPGITLTPPSPRIVGGSVEFSMINPTAIFYSSNAGLMERSADLGFSIAAEFAGAIPAPLLFGFYTPFTMWESFNNLNSPDSINYIANVDHVAGDVIEVKSKTANYKIKYTFTQPLALGDSVKIQDIISNRFFVGISNAVYMTKEALDFSKEPKWFKIANINGLPTSLAYSDDANYLFVGTSEGRLYRIANIAGAHDSITAHVNSPWSIISTTMIEEFTGRYITSVSVDQNDPARVIVTLGQYGNNDYVYFTTNSLDQDPSFSSVQGNLPKMPVYSSLFEMSTSNVLLGTEAGIYTATSLGTNTNWTSENDGMGKIPVFAIRQQTVSRPWTETVPGLVPGAIYIATLGNGIFENRLYVGLDRPDPKNKVNTSMLQVYPNPVTNQINFNINPVNASNVMVKIYDLRGNLVSVHNLGNISKGLQRISIEAGQLHSGTYFMQVITGNESQKAKFIVVK